MSSAMVMAVVAAVVGSDVVGISDGDVAGVAVVVVTGDYGQ